MKKRHETIAVWFSCGAASAIAAHETIKRYGRYCRIRVVNNPIAEEDSDNIRFLKDVEKWLGIEIEYAISSKFPGQKCVDVWDKKRYMSGVAGAPCTLELKKRARQEWEEKHKPDHCVLGFTYDEKERSNRFQIKERALLPVLIEARITKNDCFSMLKKAGIKLPRVYDKGFPNANCIGCVKATSPTYWNLVRKEYPEVFESRAEQADKYGAKLVRYKGRRIGLKQLPPSATGRPLKPNHVECGLFCDME